MFNLIAPENPSWRNTNTLIAIVSAWRKNKDQTLASLLMLLGGEASMEIDLKKYKIKEGHYAAYFQTQTKGKYQRPGQEKSKNVNLMVYSPMFHITVTH